MDEKKLNNKCYKVSLWPKIFWYFLFLLSAIFAPFMLRDGYLRLFIISTVCGISCLIVAIESNFTKIIIKSDGILKLYKFPTKSYEIKFDEIEEIIDDGVSTLGMSLHVFHLIPKSGINKKFKRFTIHEGFKNRKELLTEIISRVSPSTYVEDEVYQYIGKGHSKTSTRSID